MVLVEFFLNDRNETKYLLKVILNVAKECAYWESWVFSKKSPPIYVLTVYQFEIGSCETPNKQKKYSEKHSSTCGGEQRQDRRERPWDKGTISWDFLEGTSSNSFLIFDWKIRIYMGHSISSSSTFVIENQKTISSKDSAMKLRVHGDWCTTGVLTETVPG